MKRRLCIFMLATILAGALSLFATADSTTLPFTDVPQTAWYHSHVAKAYDSGLMVGKTDTTFDPLAPITRAEISRILATIAKADTSGYGEKLLHFADGKADQWYSDAMGWAYARGIIAGFDDNTVRPLQKITRCEIVKMVGNYINSMYFDLVETNEGVTFTDDPKIASWYKNELTLVAEAGIISGDNKGNFNPSGNATRAEAATIATKLAEAIETGIAENGITILKKGETSPCSIFTPFFDPLTHELTSLGADYVSDRLSYEYDSTMSVTFWNADAKSYTPLQIILSGSGDPDMVAFDATLGADQFGLKLVRDGECFKLLIAFKSAFTRSYAIEYILTKYSTENAVTIPADLEVIGTATANSFFTTVTSLPKGLRDPFMYYEDGTYYLYTTDWLVYKNTSGSIMGSWSKVKNAVKTPSDCDTNKWAPEVYKYNGYYYMFTTYKSERTGTRGCAIFRATSPAGPFSMITNGTITPKNWSAIDGTFYVDDKGTPWMIFSHEHISTKSTGRFYKAQLSEDLTRFVSEPTLVFDTDDAPWSNGVADGPFMYTTKNGELLMLWSSGNGSEQYTQGVSRSASGKLDGEWTHDEPFLMEKYMDGVDGGHGMVFTDKDGQMYVVLHSPNAWGTENQRITLVPITERNDTLVWDLNLD